MRKKGGKYKGRIKKTVKIIIIIKIRKIITITITINYK